jgi:choline dehydrogenase
MPILLRVFCLFLYFKESEKSSSRVYFAKRQLTLDYIICGGGTAGLAIAARLTEDPDVTVAVLEAGGNALDDLLVDAPNMFAQTWGKPNYDWDYKTVPQVCSFCLNSITCIDLHNRKERRIEFTAGFVAEFLVVAVLSTTACLGDYLLPPNDMLTEESLLTFSISMASKQDLDNWAELGNSGWSFEDLKPYYRKFETYHPASEAFGEKMDNKYLDKSLRGTSGPIHVSCWQKASFAFLYQLTGGRYAFRKATLLGARSCGLRQ